MKIVSLGLVAASCLLVMAPLAQADLIGGQDIIAAPAIVSDDAVTNKAQQGFNEKQDYTLLRNIRIDNVAPFAGSADPIYVTAGATLGIVRGTEVDSHMIFLNGAIGTSLSDQGVVWTFADEIIGVMSDPNGVFEAASNVEVANPGTTYPGSFNARGMEANDGYLLSLDRRSLTVNMSVVQPGDWIRVITRASSSGPVPEPSSLLLVAGAVSVFVMHRRKRSRK